MTADADRASMLSKLLTRTSRWGSKTGGAIGGGVITYDTGRGQRVAPATGLTEVLWPTEITTVKVVVLGLPGD